MLRRAAPKPPSALHPKKRPRLCPIKVYRDLREVCNLKSAEGRRIYARRVVEMAKRQSWNCCICHKPMQWWEPTFEHSDLRGLGGGRRDDRIRAANGRPMNGAAHGLCNSLKGSRRTA